ncbi:MAG TPA: GspH/FimT family pseudopilin [Thermoanaerobaculia bacterium]|nr:GspH/FimT family pseudopilin [Thermoanaerobaculia bacterium]
MKTFERGFQLLDLTVALAVIALVATLAAPPLDRMVRGLRLREAASELVGALRLAKSFAVRYSANVAVRFRSERGIVTFAIYRDGDGDGVRNADIASGRDPLVQTIHRLAGTGFGLRFGFPPKIVPRDPSDPRRPLDRLDDPIRFNDSDLASFDPLGGATPGSLYLTDGATGLAAVRVLSRSGRVRVLLYDAATRLWH